MDGMLPFLIELFRFNESANLQLTEFVRSIPASQEMLRHLSHLVNCQDKWLDKLTPYPEVSAMDWWFPVYGPEELSTHFRRSTNAWISYLSTLESAALDRKVPFAGMDGAIWEASARDIVLQLNFHCFHHRAQVNLLIRQSGLTPPFIDYIHTHSTKRLAEESSSL